MKNLAKTTVLVLSAAILFAAVAFGTRDNAGVVRVLQQQGYTEIKLTGYRMFAGGRDDTWAEGFEATTPSGERITGAVTYGPFRAKTIRVD